jgi:hypothetical protein
MQVAPALLPILLGVCLLTVAVLAWLAWWTTVPIADFRWRWLARFALVPLLGWCGPAAGRYAALAPRDEGTWACRHCYDYREEVRWADLTLSASEPAEPCVAEDHDWRPIGDHTFGLGSSYLCYFVPY